MKFKKNGLPRADHVTPNRCEFCSKVAVCQYITKRRKFELEYPFFDIPCKYFDDFKID